MRSGPLRARLSVKIISIGKAYQAVSSSPLRFFLDFPSPLKVKGVATMAPALPNTAGVILAAQRKIQGLQPFT